MGSNFGDESLWIYIRRWFSSEAKKNAYILNVRYKMTQIKSIAQNLYSQHFKKRNHLHRDCKKNGIDKILNYDTDGYKTIIERLDYE